MIQPTIGMSQISMNQPEWSTSWRRRAVTARDGSNRAKVVTEVTGPVASTAVSNTVASSIVATIDTRTWNSTNHQYSLRRARPEKVAYWRSAVETAVEKFTIILEQKVRRRPNRSDVTGPVR